MAVRRSAAFIDRYLAGAKGKLDTTLDAPASLVKAQRFDRNKILIHGRGFTVLSALEAVLGRESFDGIYRRAARDYAGKRLGWRELQRIAEAEAGQNLGWFFEDWVRTSEIRTTDRLARTNVFHFSSRIKTPFTWSR
jgi:hypothetical protein